MAAAIAQGKSGRRSPIRSLRRLVRASVPDGFRYQPDLISAREEETLIEQIRELPLREFEFHGYTGKRRVVYFGWRYEFSTEQLNKADDMPDFLRALRVSAAEFVGLMPDQLQHVPAKVTKN